MNNTAIVIFNIVNRGISVDLEIPLDITTKELVMGLNEAYHLEIDTYDIKQCYLKTENPIALLRGNKLISYYGIHNGTIINFTK